MALFQVSLYPWALYDNFYPLGPVTVHRDFTNIDLGSIPWRGLIKAAVLPPQSIDVPVLGYHHNKKLVFPLCKTCCVLENMKESCTHADEERAFVSPEREREPEQIHIFRLAPSLIVSSRKLSIEDIRLNNTSK